MKKNEINPNDDAQFDAMNSFDDGFKTMEDNQAAEDKEFIEQFTSRDVIEDEPVDETPVKSPQEDPTDTSNDDDDNDNDDKEDLSFDEFDENITEVEKKELDDLNKKLGTDFKDLDSLKNAIHKEENDKEAGKITEKENLLNYYNNILSQTPRDIVFEDERMKAYQAGKNVKDDDVVAEINEAVDLIEDKGLLEYASRTIVSELRPAIDKLNNEITSFKNEKQETVKQKEETRKKAIEKATSELFSQDDYYGLKLEKKAFIDAYRKVSKGNTIELIQNDPRLAMEVQLFLDNRENLSSLNNSATYSDGIKDTMNAVRGQSPEQHQTVRNNKKAKSGVSSFIADFLK